MKRFQKPGLAIALTTSVYTAQADVIYSFEDFEGESTGQLSNTANGTDYVNTANGQDKARITGTTVSGGSTANDPTGQHGEVAGDANKHTTLTNPLPSASTGATSVEISLAIHFNTTGNNNRFRIQYSASGNFDDTTDIQIFNPTGTVNLPAYTYANNQWYADQTVSFAPGDVTGGFTDTAKIRLGKVGTGQGNHVSFDDVTITGIGAVPEPTSLALVGLGGLLLARRRR